VKPLSPKYYGFIQLSGKAHEGSEYIAMIAVVYRHLCAATHPGGKVVSTVIIFCLPSGNQAIAQTVRLSHDMCINWNEL